MNVQPINGYLCLRCQVQGMLKHTNQMCWSCGQTDRLVMSMPFVSHGFIGMTFPQETRCDNQQSENWSATFAARFGGAWRGRYVLSPSAAPED